MDRGDLDRLLNAHPRAAINLLAAMGRRLRQTGELLRHTASRNANEEIEDRRTRVQKTADWIAAFSGSIAFLATHVVLFAGWILLNVARQPSGLARASRCSTRSSGCSRWVSSSVFSRSRAIEPEPPGREDRYARTSSRRDLKAELEIAISPKAMP